MQYDLISVVASRRGIIALKHLLAELPSSFGAPIACLVESWHGLLEELQQASRLTVRWAERGMRMEKGHVYISRPGESLICLADGTFGIAPCGVQSSALSPVDHFMESAAKAHGGKLLSLVLSGFDRDGVEGCECVKRLGGCVLVLDRATARYWGMAEPIIKAGAADRVLTVVEVAEALRSCFTSQDLLGCAEIQVRLGELLEAGLRMSGTAMGHVTQRTSRDTLRIIVQRGLGVEFFEQFDGMPIHTDTAWSRAVRYCHRVFVPDVADEPGNPAHRLPRVPYLGAFAVPLLLSRPQVEAHGAMTALFREPLGTPPRTDPFEEFAREAAELIARVP